jgi:RNA polymerase sigma-70 factor (ECF subfamily)
VTDNLASNTAAFEPERTRHIGRDPAALEAFYRAHYDQLLRYFTSRVSDPHDVADLVADTFVGAIAAARSYDPRRGRPIAWLFGIAHNVHRRSYRRRDADQRVASRVAGRRLLDDEDISRIEEQIDAERRLAGRQLLDGLSATERELVELVELDGFTPQEAAQATGVTSAVARIRLFRARAKLRQAFHTQEDAS